MSIGFYGGSEEMAPPVVPLIGNGSQLQQYITALSVEGPGVDKTKPEPVVLSDTFCITMGGELVGRVGEGVGPADFVRVAAELVEDCMTTRVDRATNTPLPWQVTTAPAARFDHFVTREIPVLAGAFGDAFARQVVVIQNSPPKEPSPAGTTTEASAQSAIIPGLNAV